MRVHAYAPTRIDLAGGTLDLWPLYLLFPGALTLNLAITRYAHCVVESRRDRRLVLVSRDNEVREEFASLAALGKRRRSRLPLLAELVGHFAPRSGLTLTTWSEGPAGSGLGGSSALAIAVCAALSHVVQGPSGRSRWAQRRTRMGPHEWIPLARDIEARVLGVPTGEQDHYPAVCGGAAAIHLEPGRTRHEALAVNLEALESRLLLVYTGTPRRSGINNWEVFKKTLNGSRRLRRNFARITATAIEMRQALLREEWKEVARLLRREWQTRRGNAAGISTPFIESLIRLGRRHGAQAAKACGAGGGGCVLFFTPPSQRAAVAAALARAGATLLPCRIARRGVQVERLR
jgi:D-glycero-alpha-D-manno-heptose-7-phosphate kinase